MKHSRTSMVLQMMQANTHIRHHAPAALQGRRDLKSALCTCGPRNGAQAYQYGFTDDAGQHAASQHGQVLQQEGGGHDQACGADEERHEEVADAGQLVQAVLLLVRGGQHHSRHKGPQL